MPTSMIHTKYGPWAVVTGASSGIGAEFSRQLAEHGLNVVLVARRLHRLKDLAGEIETKCSTETKIVQADLSTPDGYQTVLDDTANLDVGLLINNAGVSLQGSFLREDLQEHTKLVAVNVHSVMALAHGFARRLRKRDTSGMLFVSSMMSDPSPYFASYASSKSFVSTLSLSLHEELREDHVDVMVLEPGFVKSEMSAGAGEAIDREKMNAPIMDTDECVRIALKGMEQGQQKVVPGFSNRLFRFALNLIPEGMRMRLLGTMIASAMRPDLLKHS